MSTVKDFNIKVGDLQPYYYVQVRDAANAVVDLTGASITISMKNADSGALKINRSTTGITISDAANGKFHYVWQSGDTATAGKYWMEFEITPQVGGKFTVPSCEHYAVVYIRDRFNYPVTVTDVADTVTVTVS